MNTLRPEFASWTPTGAFTGFAVLQEAPPSHPVLRDHRIAIGLYDRTPGGLVRRRRVETDVSGERTDIGALAGEQRPDLVLVNDDDLTYAKIRLDEHSLATLMTGIGEFTESLPAALCWAAAWDMCRDAELAARDYVRLVLAGVGSVTDISVVQTLLRQASAALRRYADPAWRPAGLELAAGALRDLLERAEPGSDAQLAYVQAFTGVATSPGDLALLAGLLDGSGPIDGLTVDTELRWRLLRRLISRGAAGEAEIEAELARDATDAGARRAAACRAAIPDAGRQGGRLAADRQRHAAQCRVPGGAGRLHRSRPARAAGAVPAALLRGGRRHLAGLEHATWRSGSWPTPTRSPTTAR